VSEAALDFTRIILGFDRSAPDRTALRFAAELAKLLHLNLLGLFAQDPQLSTIAGLPLLREFRVIERQWRPIESQALLNDLETSAALARRMLDEVARASGISPSFLVMAATAAKAIADVSSPTDIVMVAEPRTPTDKALRPFSEIVSAALTTPASVLVFPSRLARDRGPVLAIVPQKDDASVAIARTIASALNEPVNVVEANGELSASLRSPPGQSLERMIVMTRQTADLSPLSIAAERNVPVLVVGGSDDPSPRRRKG
jgi:hypothetical protein